MTGTIVAVTGLKREARTLAGPSIRPIPGGGAARLEPYLDLACDGAAGIISIGLAGALAEGLKPGQWVIGSGVMVDGALLDADAAWTARLADRLSPARCGLVFADGRMVSDAAEKRALHASTGAIAVDMESHVAARVARRHRLPFAIARVISDAADRALPRAAQAGMKSDGSMDVLAVLAALARRPWELPALVRTAVEAETAFRALLRGRQLLGGALVGPGSDLG